MVKSSRSRSVTRLPFLSTTTTSTLTRSTSTTSVKGACCLDCCAGAAAPRPTATPSVATARKRLDLRRRTCVESLTSDSFPGRATDCRSLLDKRAELAEERVWRSIVADQQHERLDRFVGGDRRQLPPQEPAQQVSIDLGGGAPQRAHRE